MPGVPLAPSDILKVLLVSNKGARETFPLLTVWNNCKAELLRASQSLKQESGKTFWGKVLASKVSSDADSLATCCHLGASQMLVDCKRYMMLLFLFFDTSLCCFCFS